MADRTKYLHTALSAAVSAGNALRAHSGDFLHLKQLSKESHRDIVTEIDRLAEDTAIAKIREFDKNPIVAEESGESVAIDPQRDSFWVIDPLDGTVNYVHHIPLYAVSIAFIEKGIPTVGVIYNPALNELYYGGDGLGVFKNHSRIAAAGRPLEGALCSITFSGAKYDTDRNSEFDLFQKLNDATAGCLRTGSASVNLSYLAEGKLDIAIGRHTKLWDVAAGLALARLAGAEVDFTFVDKKKYLLHYRACHASHKDALESLDPR